MEGKQVVEGKEQWGYKYQESGVLGTERKKVSEEQNNQQCQMWWKYQHQERGRQCRELTIALAARKPVGSFNKNSFSGITTPENGVEIPSIAVGSKYEGCIEYTWVIWGLLLKSKEMG